MKSTNKMIQFAKDIDTSSIMSFSDSGCVYCVCQHVIAHKQYSHLFVKYAKVTQSVAERKPIKLVRELFSPFLKIEKNDENILVLLCIVPFVFHFRPFECFNIITVQSIFFCVCTYNASSDFFSSVLFFFVRSFCVHNFGVTFFLLLLCVVCIFDKHLLWHKDKQNPSQYENKTVQRKQE